LQPRHAIRRFTFAALPLLLIAGARLVAARTAPDAVAVYPTLVVHNARIYTMDSALSVHEAMAIRGARVWKLGSNTEIRAYAGRATQVIDAKGRTILPGLIDAHTHPHVWGVLHWGHQADGQLQWLYVEAKDLDGLKARLAERVGDRIREAGVGKWIIAPISRELGARALAGGITATELDRIAPDTPLIVVNGLIGGLIANAKARQEMLRVLGRDVSLDDAIQMWSLVMYDIVLKGRTGAAADLITREMNELVPLGVTTIMSNVGSPQVMRSLNALDREQKMPLRWAWVHRSGFSLAKDPAQFYSMLGDIAGQGSEFLWNIGVGEEAWDTVWCTSVEPVVESLRDVQRRDIQSGDCQSVPGSRLYEGHLTAARNGLRLADSHMYGDMALKGAVQIADTVIGEHRMTLQQVRDQKWGFDHGYLLPPDTARTFAKYGFWMSFQARAITREDRISQTYGPQYASWVLPVKAWLDAGARFTLNTDAHLTLGSSEEERLQDRLIGKSLWDFWPDAWRNTVWPWLAVWVTREVNGKVYSPEKKLDRTTAMKAWTVWPAEFLLRPNDIGSLEPGKLADFIVIDKNYFAVPESEIATIRTLMTAVGGRISFRAADF
jgi:predicted amidohydrolase YtcJ